MLQNYSKGIIGKSSKAKNSWNWKNSSRLITSQLANEPFANISGSNEKAIYYKKTLHIFTSPDIMRMPRLKAIRCKCSKTKTWK